MSGLASLSFIPAVAAKVIVTINFSAQGSASIDFGGAYVSKAFMIQNGVTTFGNAIPMGNTRASQTIKHIFDVVAGTTVECGLTGVITGAVAASWWDISITAEVIKR